MRVVSKKENFNVHTEIYNFNDSFADEEENKGLAICYAIASSKQSSIISIECEAEQNDALDTHSWFERYSRQTFFEKFPDFWGFSAECSRSDFGHWTIVTMFKGVEVTISGKRSFTDVGVLYHNEKALNILAWFHEVEEETYNYNKYDRDIMEVLHNQYELSEKIAVKSIKKLLTHPDVYAEFSASTILGAYPEPDLALQVEGITAEYLNRNFPLSMIGAYNYLIFLREEPEEAICDLRFGLSREIYD